MTETEVNMLEKIRALLAKAEATPYPEEAKAFSEGAQRLMQTYAITELHLQMTGDGKLDKPIQVTLRLDNPYAKSKAFLLAVVASKNRCKTVQKDKLTIEENDGQKRLTVWLFGRKSDTELVEMLYTSLCIQMTKEMIKAKVGPRENTKAFRNSFVLGYAQSIQTRLRKATEEVAVDSSMALVLVDNKAEIDAMIDDTFGKLGTTSHSRSSAAGFGSGAEAGRRASIDRNSLDSRKALN